MGEGLAQAIPALMQFQTAKANAKLRRQDLDQRGQALEEARLRREAGDQFQREKTRAQLFADYGEGIAALRSTSHGREMLRGLKDAPLDEANIARFIKMLDRFIRDSQFVIVTHSKRTMSRCEVIYGVTMQEFGVSSPMSMEMTSEPSTAGAK